jgi:hypothetical protein
MLADAAAFFLPPADALLHGGQRLRPARLGEASGEFRQAGLEAGGKAPGDRDLLGRAPLGMAIQPDLRTVLADDVLQRHDLVRCGQGLLGVFRIEPTGAFAADHEIAVALRPQPEDVGGGGDAGIHDDQRAGGRAEALEHLLQRRTFRDVAGEQGGVMRKNRIMSASAGGRPFTSV